MTFAFISVVVGLALLAWSADRFVEGAAATARHFGLPPMLICMVIIGVGTSLTELTSSLVAARMGEHDLALSNVIGSNLFNTLAVVGTTIRFMAPLSALPGSTAASIER